MTAERFRALIEGAIDQWRVDARLHFDTEMTRCVIAQGDTTITIEHQETGPGRLWRIETPGRTARIHRSVVPALATLRDTLCPDRARGRALFVQPPADAP